MTEYFLEPCSIHPHMYFIYKDTENTRKVAMVVYGDIDLANRILEFLKVEVPKE